MFPLAFPLPLKFWAASVRFWQQTMLMQVTLGLLAVQAAAEVAMPPAVPTLSDAAPADEALPPAAENAPV